MIAKFANELRFWWGLFCFRYFPPKAEQFGDAEIELPHNLPDVEIVNVPPAPPEAKPHPGRVIASRVDEFFASRPDVLEMSLSKREYETLVDMLSLGCEYSKKTNLWTWHVKDKRRFCLLEKAQNLQSNA